MRVGPGIALLALGAILAFAVSDNFSGVDLTTIGYILMGAGVLGIILGLVLTANANRGVRSSTTRRVVDDGTTPPREEVTRREVD
ncbi:DUF6458 family protein [Auraticoccus monumenti]|uniref:DUF6458 domain-containing protein n=1 Tax=Auraticoccus monumenti TaxID=675864 RepID=A0A1G6WBP1_9ACTN|nr:DUF6458 family protein [Auraticoccus monumenti]SDD63209.1 hypothetical protein SAMN04489747_1399 [Auraticoccus monumenti]